MYDKLLICKLVERVEYLEKSLIALKKNQPNYIGETERECSQCHDIKLNKSFSPTYGGKIQSSCKKCRSDKATAKNRGIV